ncbi:MAG TPA: alpha-2-macroglobulin family protein [Verrucomicrobiales bacterium]|nr:alpha-2-macroglobulin family protein [Verrucomicrobiales bacterium]
MKTNATARALLAVMVCFTAQVTSMNTLAQGAKSQPKASSAAPGVEITDPEGALGAGKDVEVNFSVPMVPESQKGKTVPVASVLDIKPALAADLVWESSRSATLKLKGPVPPGSSYRISVRKDLKDAAGKAVVPGPAVTAYGPAFTVEQHLPRWFSISGADARQPAITLLFNDEVNAETAAKLAFFSDKTNRMVAAKAEALTVGALGKYPPAFGRWNDRHGSSAEGGPPGEQGPMPPPEAPALSAVKVMPASLLPPGEDWKLIVPAQFPNAGNTAKTTAPYLVQYGTIPVMQVHGAEAEPVLDGPRALHVTFNKSAAELKGADWGRFISVTPVPPDLKWETAGRQVTMKGKFQHGATYTVKVLAGAPALDQTTLGAGFEKKVQFEAHPPHLSLPSFDAAQWLGGRGVFEFATANLKSVMVKVKRIAPDRAVDALRGYAVYLHDESNKDGYENTRVPYAAISGKTVWEKDFPSKVELDHSERFQFTWDEIGGGKRAPGMYFVNTEGDPKEEVKGAKRQGSQTLVQLTDIGLAWKFSGKDALIYAFSHTSGKPLAGVSLQSYTDENDAVEKQTTGADGMARMQMDKTKWLLAQKEGDLHGIAFDKDMPELDMWSFDLPYTERAPDKAWKEMLLFTERPVYQPGETVFFKAIQRMHSADGLSMPPAGEAAKLRLYDPQHRLLVERDVKFSETGTLADTLRMPAQGLGWYRMRISFEPALKPGEKPAVPAEEEEGEEGGSGGGLAFEQQILVQEYQPNSFRIDFAEKDVQREGDTVKVPLTAAYLMGKPLSDAEVTWTSRISQAPFAPVKWDAFRFCNARSYYVWDGQEYHSMSEEQSNSPLLTGQGTVKLSEKGQAVIEAKAPLSFGVPGPKNLSVQTEVTDINQQTISASWTKTEHSSEFYLGARRGPNAVRVGEELSMELAAVKPDGTRVEQAVPVSVLVEHLAWNAVRVETAGGGSSVRNDLVFAKVSDHSVTVNPAGGSFAFKPAVAGTHNITFTAKDAKGAEVRTVVSVDVFGANDLSWQQKDGVKIDLVPDKDSYKGGETAKVVVKTPLKGTALVTVERSKVLWQKVMTLEPGGVAEIPVDEAWAPNVFVSVTHVRGGADDPREIKSPEYRVGFCPLHVESRRHLLALDIKPSKPEYRPGEMVEVNILAKDSEGKGLPNTELAFWAVDEGILSLMPWEAPNIVETFHYDQSLFVHTGISLTTLMKENPKELDFMNKGFVIGGGGEDGAVNIGMRRNFKPTAYWHGTLKTGEGGGVKVSFPAPDNLTEFRLVAVGNEGVDRFGTAEGKFKVNKPLMLEPAMPRFANAGDQITLKAVVHNTTAKQAEVKVSLTIDDHCALLGGIGGEAIEGKSQTQTVSLAPQGTRAALFTVKFVADGPAVFRWKADGGSQELADAVESKLDVGLAEPLLREVNFLGLTSADDGKNLLAGVRPEVLEGKGEVTITLSNSRALEGAEAVSQLLHYPYGCAEQTMSSMLPWLALRDLKKALPSINRPDEEIALAVQKGVDRLLSMQTAKGGLAYWPGGETENAWATAHGAVGLVLASRVGAEVPQTRLDSLLTWLSGSLREAATETNAWQLGERAYAAWALALAGKPEPAYHEVLYGQRGQLNSYARAMLALAIAEASGPADMAKTLLAMKADAATDWWLGGESTHAIRALALMKLKDPSADAEMGRLMASRSPRGDWRNTFNNAWVLLALSREAASMPEIKAGQPCVLTLDGKTQEIALPGEPASQSTSFKHEAGTALPQLTAKVPAGAKFFARVEVTGRGKSGPQPARSAGFSIDRSWQRVATDGSLSPATQLKTGDLVLVSLNVTVPAPAEYLVIDDPLPATMEGVNPNFGSMVAEDRQGAVASWVYDHAEMHRDRMLFFRDYFDGKGKFRLQYLARVVAAGDVMAPPSRIEMMYDPARFGHSPSQRVTTRASADEEVAVK